MRLRDAGLRQRRTKALYPNHRLPPWPTEDAAPRSLEPIVRHRRDHRETPCLVDMPAQQLAGHGEEEKALRQAQLPRQAGTAMAALRQA
jgi:hypothetical protein